MIRCILFDTIALLFLSTGVCRGVESGPITGDQGDPSIQTGGGTITGSQICCGQDGLPYIPQLPPGVPAPGQPLPSGGDTGLPGAHYPGGFVPGSVAYPGPVIPQQDIPIYQDNGEFTGFYDPQGGVYPGQGEGQDVGFPGEPEGCCPPPVYTGDPYPGAVAGSQRLGSNFQGVETGQNGQIEPSNVWQNGTHTRWTVSKEGYCKYNPDKLTAINI